MHDINNYILKNKYNEHLTSLIIIYIYDNKICDMEVLFKQLFNDFVNSTYPGGYLYCMHNEMFQFYGTNIYKLGWSTDYIKRKNGYTTPYIAKTTLKHVSQKIKHCLLAETLLFTKLQQYRIKSNREFFNCDLSIIIKTITEIEHLMEKSDDFYKLYCQYIVPNNKITNFILSFKLFVNNYISLFQSLHFNKMDSVNEIQICYKYNGVEFTAKTKDDIVKLQQIQGLDLLFGKDVDCDALVIKKVEVVREIICVLGFDLNDLDKIICMKEFYKNGNILITNSIFATNYKPIRELFDKPWCKLDNKLTGGNLVKMINSFLYCCKLQIKCNKKSERCKKLKKVIKASQYKLQIIN